MICSEDTGSKSPDQPAQDGKVCEAEALVRKHRGGRRPELVVIGAKCPCRMR